MPIQPQPIKTAQQAAADWVAGATTTLAATRWAEGIAKPKRDPFQAALAQAGYWQDQVSSPQALLNYQVGLSSINEDLYLQIVNTRGKINYTGGVKDKQANYAAFAGKFMGWLANEIQSLDRTNPRGDKSANRARLNAYLDALEAQAGQFRVK